MSLTYDTDIVRNCDYFKKLEKQDAMNQLAEHEMAGTLASFIARVAPDYVVDGQVQKFTLANDLRFI
jgi:hypothetical protein